ncbi:MAG: histidine kinase dimerization/phospho-acceptor domain-containing protein [Verrucomicrobiales bacterium]|nr:histidine kinase dimerization/phospho-acceptor domain-containing protein [Verrucomicrobiales bacterium]
MKSIESHIVRRLLFGQGILWTIAALSVWHSQRSRLYSEFDNNQKFVAAALRFHVRNSTLENEVRNRWPRFLTGEEGWHFQSWDEEQNVQVKSEGLGEAELSYADFEKAWASREETAEYVKFNLEGPDGEPLRGVATVARSFRNGMFRRSSSQSKDVLVTRSRRELDENLLWLAVFVFVTGVGASLATAKLVKHAVRQGLFSLRQMSEKAQAIDVSNLDVRFEENDLPIELQPISRRLNDLLRRIESGFIRERRFSSDLAHEIRTPITGLKSAAELLLKWPEETTLERHEQILEMANQMEGIIESLLLLASWESGASPGSRDERVKIEEVVRQCRENESALAAKKNLEYACSLSDSLEINADPALFRLIVANLISNAVSYADENSVIRIANTDGLHPVLSISNSIKCFDESEISNLTKRFWRADKSRSDNVHCGLGLSIVEACATRMGWKLTIAYEASDSVLTFSVGPMQLAD